MLKVNSMQKNDNLWMLFFQQEDADKDRVNENNVFNDIGEWDNDMAKNMMSLEQELEAFGEELPEPRKSRNGYKNEDEDD